VPYLSLIVLALMALGYALATPLADRPDPSWRVTVYYWAILSGPSVWIGQLWRLITYAFVHGDFHHIAWNTGYLIFLGQRLEWFQGRWRTACILFVACMTTGLLEMICRPTLYFLGMSGGTFGMNAALLVIAIRYRKVFPRKLSRTLWFWVFVAASLWELQGLFHWGHVGGIIGGLAAVLVVGRSPLQRHISRKRLTYGLAGIGLVFLAMWAVAMFPYWTDPAEGYYQLGHRRSYARNYASAIRAYEKAIAAGGDAQKAYLCMGDAAMSLGDADQAMEAYRQATAVGENPAKGYWGIAWVFREEGDLPQAVVAYRTALRHDPDLIKVKVYLGDTLRELDRNEEALAAYRSAVEQDPSDVAAHWGMGKTCRKLGRPEGALVSFEQCVKFDPNASWAYAEIGSIQRELNRLPEAYEAYEEALTLADYNVDYCRAAAEIATELGRYEDALMAYTWRIRVRHSSDPDMHWQIGLIHRELGNVELAIATMRRALYLWPTDRPVEEETRIVEQLETQFREQEADTPGAPDAANGGD
jgi:tetratricopeptide (TPR) repeat protein/membrane associated rhomboid family serine protease